LFGPKWAPTISFRSRFSQRLLGRARQAFAAPGGAKGPPPPPSKETDAKPLEPRLLRMDPERHTAAWRTSRDVDGDGISHLQALATRPGVVKIRNALMDAAYDDQVYVSTIAPSTATSRRLRKKFKSVTTISR